MSPLDITDPDAFVADLAGAELLAETAGTAAADMLWGLLADGVAAGDLDVAREALTGLRDVAASTIREQQDAVRQQMQRELQEAWADV